MVGSRLSSRPWGCPPVSGRPLAPRGQREITGVLCRQPAAHWGALRNGHLRGKPRRRDLAQIVHGLYAERWSGVLILSNGGIGTSASSSPPSRSGVPPKRPRQGFLS